MNGAGLLNLTTNDVTTASLLAEDQTTAIAVTAGKDQQCNWTENSRQILA